MLHRKYRQYFREFFQDIFCIFGNFHTFWKLSGNSLWLLTHYIVNMLKVFSVALHYYVTLHVLCSCYVLFVWFKLPFLHVPLMIGKVNNHATKNLYTALFIQSTLLRMYIPYVNALTLHTLFLLICDIQIHTAWSGILT